jgi:hypothetical protein
MIARATIRRNREHRRRILLSILSAYHDPHQPWPVSPIHSFYIVLLGAEINAELELQTAKDTTAGKPRPMGERGAFVADHVAGGPDGEKRPVSPVTRDPAAAKPGGA